MPGDCIQFLGLFCRKFLILSKIKFAMQSIRQISLSLSLCLVVLTGCKSLSSLSVETMSLEEQIGQMILIGFQGTTTENAKKVGMDIEKYGIGGVVIYDYDVATKGTRNIESPTQLESLVKGLQSKSQIPLLVTIDQEGGRVNRLKTTYGFPSFSMTAQRLGELDNLDSTRYWANLTAVTLADMGINVNYSPVVDVNIDPTSPAIGKIGRSYSADPMIVKKHAESVIEAYRKKGVISCLKHFPGHGSAQADSHAGFTDVTNTWNPKELTPYSELIKAGTCDMIMTAHIFNRKLDPDYPATLSKKIMGEMLRDSLGWNGIIISDDMLMGAIANNYGLEEAIFRAIDAGVDILLFSNNSPDKNDPEIAGKAIAIIKKLIREGRISEKRIYESANRILSLKKEF